MRKRAAIRIPKAAEVVAAAIRRQVTGGELQEGDNLPPEAQLVEEFGVSRPTLREAFRILESEQLISVSRGARGGAKVHTPQASHLARYAGFVLQSQRATYRDVYQARIMIEPPAARLVAELRSEEVPTILRNIVAAEREADRSGDFGGAVATFHTRLVEFSGNQTLILISKMLEGIVARYQSMSATMRRSAGENLPRETEAGLRSQEKLIALIEAGDGAAAELHWRAHMENSTKVWLSRGRADSVIDWDD